MKTALIAGGGIAGLASAVYLDSLGYRVTLLERRNILGGRTYSFTDKKTGLTLDNGQHVLAGAYHHTLEFLQKVGATSKIAWLKPTNIKLVTTQQKRIAFTLNTWPWPLAALKAILSFKGLTIKDKLLSCKIYSELKNDHERDETVQAWLNRLGQSQVAQKNFWDIITYATLNDAPDKTVATGLKAVLAGLYLGERDDGFLIVPKVGLSEVFANPAETYLKMRGHTVQAGLGLTQIRILDNKVQAFACSDGEERKADVYVCALPFQQVKNTLPPAFLQSHPQLKHMGKMLPSPIVSINLFFDPSFMSDAFIGSAYTKTHWFFRKTLSAPQHIVGVISGGYEFLDWSKEDITALAHRDLMLLYPAAKGCTLLHSLVNIERHATLSLRPGINSLRPKQHLLDNFFLIGDWTDTGLPPTIESAVTSAKRVYEACVSTA